MEGWPYGSRGRGGKWFERRWEGVGVNRWADGRLGVVSCFDGSCIGKVLAVDFVDVESDEHERKTKDSEDGRAPIPLITSLQHDVGN